MDIIKLFRKKRTAIPSNKIPKETKSRSFTFLLTPSLSKRLTEVSQRTGLKKSEIITSAIMKYMDQL